MTYFHTFIQLLDPHVFGYVIPWLILFLSSLLVSSGIPLG